MGLNPFGEESNSVHAWKERYKQQKFQLETTQSQLNDKKSTLEQLQVKYEEVSRQLREREEELSSHRQELKEMRELLKSRDKELRDLRQSTDTKRLERLEEENKDLRGTVEELQGRINRGAANRTQPNRTKSDTGNLTVSLIPFMLREYDPQTHDYKDAFINLVETVIEEGETMAKIIAILIKYGGRGPTIKIKNMVDTTQFEVAIDTLVDSGLVERRGSQIQISESSSSQIDSAEPVHTTPRDDHTPEDWEDKPVKTTENFDNLSNEELFDKMADMAKNASKEQTMQALRDFRDTLQTRDIPLTTIFFEIRKMIERIDKEQVDRKDLYDQIQNWKQKYERLTQ